MTGVQTCALPISLLLPHAPFQLLSKRQLACKVSVTPAPATSSSHARHTNTPPLGYIRPRDRKANGLAFWWKEERIKGFKGWQFSGGKKRERSHLGRARKREEVWKWPFSIGFLRGKKKERKKRRE